MTLNDYSRLMIPEIEKALKSTILKDIPDPFPGLKEMMNYHFGWLENGKSQKSQGKQIRPIILLLSNSICGGDWKKALPAAIAIELIHNFSLIHDDIEDQSDLRRGRETLWKIYGIPQAINTGDAMFSLAQINMLKLGYEINKQIGFDSLQKLNETCLHLTGGQNLDISFEKETRVSLDRYLLMIGGKTAALLSASAEIGAITALTSESNRKALRNYGNALGLAFQAWDDWLGIWGEEEQTGKSTSSDLITGKKSLPILFALDKGGDFSRIYLSNGVNQENFHELLFLLENNGAKEFTENIAKQFTDTALKSLEEIKVSDQNAFQSLLELTDLLITRKN
ncbi:MAG: polyprenyl synthetase [Chloroflexi bacterium HGW-Chloroflexi-3]|nr:MAG: polyprenyl synthetase [Chloroflexi bacterium HGW-Chloroflexi-3]